MSSEVLPGVRSSGVEVVEHGNLLEITQTLEERVIDNEFSDAGKHYLPMDGVCRAPGLGPVESGESTLLGGPC